MMRLLIVTSTYCATTEYSEGLVLPKKRRVFVKKKKIATRNTRRHVFSAERCQASSIVSSCVRYVLCVLCELCVCVRARMLRSTT